jgi:hypothetical protein
MRRSTSGTMWVIGGASVIALFLAVLCPYIYGRPKKADLIFNHKYHTKDLELSCDTCHEGATTEVEAGLPSEETCQVCHEFDREKPSKACLTCHSTTKPKIARERKAEYADVIFSHAKHAGMECGECHPGVEKSTQIRRGKYIPTMERCLKCHAELGVSQECETCHEVVRKEEKPSSHGAGFDRAHGTLSEMKDAQCALCHQSDFCQECHLEKKPQSHTLLWKTKAHGRLAMVDRSSCKTCHRTDFCIACHTETEPISHNGGWGSPQNTHCLTCHLPLSMTGCFVCHKEARHETAVDASWHPDDWRDCRACHPSILTTTPRHPDPGVSCTQCHRI